MKHSVALNAKLAILGLLLVSSGTAFAQSATFPNPPNSTMMANPTTTSTSPSGWTNQWRMIMGGEGDETLDTSRQFVLTRFDLNMRYLLDDSLVLKVVPSASFQSGASQAWYGTNEQENQIYLSEASVTWKPSSYFVTKAGALDQSETHTSLLAGQRPFPGLLTGIMAGEKNFRYGVFAGAAIPTSMSLTTYDGEQQQVPSLQTAQIRTDWTSGPLLGVSFMVGGWQYANLPSGTANESAILGNKVTQLSDSEAAFVYNYVGVESSLKAHFPIGRWDGETDIAGIENTAAPAGRSLGWKTHGQIKAPITSRLDIIAGGMYYHLESDAAVASFVDQDYFGTNRNGYYAEGGVAFGKHKTRLLGRVGESNVIYDNDPQSRDQFFLLKLETDYAIF